jgi:HPt (histidine-containing phosphotransfer) domain-containing protein
LDIAITSQLLELEEEEPGFLAEVIESFFVTAEESIERMKEAIEAGDSDALRAAAHMVRGSGQQLGAQRFAATCARLESIGALAEAPPLVVELERDLERARESLTNLADRALDAAC